MPWYRIKGFIKIEGVPYSPGDHIFLTAEDAERYPAALELDEMVPTVPLITAGKVVKLKKLDPWWKRLIS